MDQRVKKLWVDALRSGEFSQVIGALRKPMGLNGEGVGYCCLGVLCELYRCDTNDGQWQSASEDVYFTFFKEGGYLPYAVRVWAGLPSKNPHARDGISSAADLNDVGASFQEIAEWIEREL